MALKNRAMSGHALPVVIDLSKFVVVSDDLEFDSHKSIVFEIVSFSHCYYTLT